MTRFSAALCPIIGFLAALECQQANGDETYRLAITNNSGKAIQYAVRGGENTGRARPYKTINHANGTTQSITYTASADYGLVFRVPQDERQWGRVLFGTRGPYDIRANNKVFDREGTEIPEGRMSD